MALAFLWLGSNDRGFYLNERTSAVNLIFLFPQTTADSEDVEAGENMRRSDDMALGCSDLKKFFGGDWHKAIGIIQYPIGNNTERGTGFRVGSKYIVTAFHVMKEYFSKSWVMFLNGQANLKDERDCYMI